MDAFFFFTGFGIMTLLVACAIWVVTKAFTPCATR